MAEEALPTPAFGEADLSNCEREQIHLAGSIQPHGVLLVLREPELVVVQASANAAAFLGLPGEVVGLTLASITPDLPARLALHLSEPLDTIPIPIRCTVGLDGKELDSLSHRAPGGGLVVELERAGPVVDLETDVSASLDGIVGAASIRALCDETARIFRALTGYDRVMVYHFDEDGHGEVVSEEKRDVLEAFLGNRYPASDIPQIARRLYERNRVRVLVDVQYEPVALAPRLSPFTGEDLDMSLCFMRSTSPIHIQYLKNMGVCATLVVSLIVGGRLWGLVSCHHYEPRSVHFEMRSVCELLAEARGDTHRRPRELRAVASRALGPPHGAADGGGHHAGRRLARSALRLRPIDPEARERDRRGPADGWSGDDRGRRAGDRGAARDRALARCQGPAGDGLGGHVRDLLAPARRAGVRRARRRRRRAAGHSALQPAWRLPRLVPSRAGPHGDVGRQPLQARGGRQQSRRPLTAPLLLAMAPGRRGNVRAVVCSRAHHGAPHRQHRERRRDPVPRRWAC